MLGLTATPYRMDNRISSSFVKTMWSTDQPPGGHQQGLLGSFHYYGIYDDTVDYNQIAMQNGRYVAEELEKALTIASGETSS